MSINGVIINGDSRSTVVTIQNDPRLLDALRAEVKLYKLDDSVDRIALVLFAQQSLSSLNTVKNQLLGDAQNCLASFELDEEARSSQCVLLGEVYKKSGDWRFSVVSSAMPGGIESVLKLYDAKLEWLSAPTKPPVAAPQQGPASSALRSQRGDPVICHKVDYEIFGHESQIVEVELDPGEVVVAEAGAMNYMDSGVEYESKMGDGSNPKPGFLDNLLSVGRRLITGESLMMTHFKNTSSRKRRVAFAAPYPGTIIALDMLALNTTVLCQKDAFLAAALGTEISIAFNKKIGAGFFGGEGFILQKLKGDGLAFIHAGGCVVEKELDNETLYVDTGCLVAFTSGIDYDIKRVKGLKSIFFGGEGLFLVTLSGSGTVWLQSAPFSRFADRVLAHAPSAGGSARGEGSVLGGLGRILDGD
jgi:uncharacterized protein (TIGR00266 family)